MSSIELNPGWVELLFEECNDEFSESAQGFSQLIVLTTGRPFGATVLDEQNGSKRIIGRC